MGDVIDRHCAGGWLNHSWLKNETPVFLAMVLLFNAVVLTSTILSPNKSLAAALPASEFVVPSGPVIILQDGQSIDGHIIKIDQTNVMIRTTDGIEQTLPRATIDRVRFETVTGMEIAGELIGWKPGVYELTTAEAVVTVYSTVSASPEEPEKAESATAKAENDEVKKKAEEEIIEAVAKREAEPVDANVEKGAVGEVAAATTNGKADSSETAPADGVDEQVATASPTSDLEINVSTANARENSKAVAFDIELSRPSENSVVLIYATIDGTAIDGEDYVAARGVMVIKAGETTARIEAPMIDDDISEDDEDLQLFLTADPAVAVVRNRKIIATIEDDDQD